MFELIIVLIFRTAVCVVSCRNLLSGQITNTAQSLKNDSLPGPIKDPVYFGYLDCKRRASRQPLEHIRQAKCLPSQGLGQCHQVLYFIILG